MRPLNIFTATALVSALLYGGAAKGAVSGPNECAAGELAIVTSDVSAAWAVHPVEYQTAIYPTENGTKCVFASPKIGTVTFFAATVMEGAPTIETHVIYNGGKAPTPTPEPTPAPAPDTLEGVAKALLDKITSDKKEEGKAAIVESIDVVISGIDRGTITTVPGARGTFRGVWSVKAAGVGDGTQNEWAEWVTGVSVKLDQSDIKTMRTGFQILQDLLAPTPKETPKPVVKEPAIAPKADPKKKPTTDNCSSGNCPTTQNYTRWGRK